MLRKLTFIAGLTLTISGSLLAQNNFKNLPEASPRRVDIRVEEIIINPQLRTAIPLANNPLHRLTGFRFDLNKLNVPTIPRNQGVKITVDQENGQVFQAQGRPRNLKAIGPTELDARNYLRLLGPDLGIVNPAEEIAFAAITTDTLGQTHVRLRQLYQGLPVEPADAYLHASGPGGFDSYLGRLQPSPIDLSIEPGVSVETIIDAAKASFGPFWKELPEEQLAWVGEAQMATELVIFYHEATPYLAYRLELHPNLITHLTRYVDAHAGAVIHEHQHVCGTAGLHAALPPETARVRNLDGDFVTINTFSQQNQFFLFDVSRPMFRQDNDGSALGVIHTFDAGGQSPLNDDFDPTVGTSNNNADWSRTSVSVHHNAGLAYSYYLDRFERNSIDGAGGTVYSFFNVNNEDGEEMDNAFWGGRSMFYGNGNRGFNQLPKALDVAGHEMTHGVIQATADLIYEIQPGAINESMADIFGYLIEGETGDHRLGEDVVNTTFFRSGALRNLRDPNNGGNRFGDRGWQPAHMDEYVNLANNEDNDYGGVHVNSGIPNRAFYLFSTSAGIGDARAERVYYRALSTYLTRSSQFADLRIAVANAARDLYGTAAETAANNAFAAVGIGGEAGDFEEDIEINTGVRFLLYSDPAQETLFLADESGDILSNPLATVDILSRPSITDDGSAAFFVDAQNRLRVIDFVNNRLLFVEENPSTVWRNIAVSKDGRRIAITTTQQDNRIFIGDLDSGTTREMILTNPTTATGINTDNVRYPDILEWDPGGWVG
ncbi:MAG: M4 family metallopeptidase [Bacteroidota bacterium]